MPAPPADTHDPRSRRTRDALHGALFSLMVRQRYASIRIEDLLRCSGVGRSTFYDHFRGKDALLLSAMDDALRLLAALPTGQAPPDTATRLFRHLHRQREQTRGLFAGRPLDLVRRALAAGIEARLAQRALRVPHRLAACMLAEATLAPLQAWLSGTGPCTAEDLAATLADAGTAALEAMREPAGSGTRIATSRA